jgi:hypothetical protein
MRQGTMCTQPYGRNFARKEDVADNWGKKLLANYFRTHYWYVPKPAWKIIGLVLRAISAKL